MKTEEDTEKEIRNKEKIRDKHRNKLIITRMGEASSSYVKKGDNFPWCEDCFSVIEDIIEIETNMPIPAIQRWKDPIDVHNYAIHCHCNGYKPKDVDCYITYGFRGWKMR